MRHDAIQCSAATLAHVLLTASLLVADSEAADWPTFLHDFDRSGVTTEQLDLPLRQCWVRQPPTAPRRAWTEATDRNVEGKDLYDRIGFDEAFQVAVAGDNLYFGSSVDHKLYCLDARSGGERWSFFTGAPIRLAPTIANGSVYIGSDDGYAYCLDAENGRLLWKYRPGPAEEWFLGRGEMISRWPVRTGILVDAGVAYFGAGIFPHENVYLCAINAVTGDVVWRNDSISHQEAGREDLSPQGYLIASSKHIYVPSGRTLPKSLDRKTGKLLGSVVKRLGISSATVAGTNAIMLDGQLNVYSPGSHVAGTQDAGYVTTGTHVARLNGRSYSKVNSAASKLRSELRDLYSEHATKSISDEQYQQQSMRISDQFRALDEESVVWRTPCAANSSLIVAGDHVFAGGVDEVVGFEAATGKQVWSAKVDGDACGLAAAAGQLFVSTSNGRVYAFGAELAGENVLATPRFVANPFPEDQWTSVYKSAAAEILRKTAVKRGFCLVVDSDEGRLAYELARQSELKIYAVEQDEQKVESARRAIAKTGLYGSRITVHHVDDLTSMPYSNYFANLIVSDALIRTGQLPASAELLARHLKPAGGLICLGQPDGSTTRPIAASSASEWLSRTQLDDHSLIQRNGSWITLKRGTLPGAGNWSHQYGEPGNSASSGDKLIKGGLGVLWYGDPGPDMMVNRHQGAVGPLVVDGRMFIQGEESLQAYDAYNGLYLWEVENPEALRTGVFQNRSPGNLVAGEDLLYHMVRERVFAHDVATGEVKTVYRLPPSVDQETHEWGYVAYRDGLLFGTATTREIIKRHFRRRGNPGGASTDAIFAIDTKTGKHLWVYQGKSIDFQAIAIGPHRVYFIDSSVTSEQREEILRQDKTELKSLTGEAARLAEERMKKRDVRLAVAIDAPTGQLLWKKPVDVTDCSDVGTGGGKLTLIYQDDTLVLCGANANGHYWKQFIEGEFKRRRLVALSATLGYKLWAKDANYRHRPIIMGDRVIAEPWAFDLRTGEQQTRTHPLTGEEVPWSIARPGHHCGMLTASEDMLIFRSGFTGFYDLNSDSGTRHFAGHRLGCWINAIPTNGLVVMPEASAGCVCMFSIASTIVLEPRKPRRPWSLFSQTGATTPVRHMALNFGAPGDRRDHTGKLWLAWPRPSDKPRNKATNRTGLALEFDVETTFLDNGGFFSHDGDAAVVESEDNVWLGSSGGQGLTRFSVPLLGAGDRPAHYTVRLHLTRAANSASDEQTCDVIIQGNNALQNLSVPAETSGATTRLVREFKHVRVTDNLVVQLVPRSDATGATVVPVIAAMEIERMEGL